GGRLGFRLRGDVVGRPVIGGAQVEAVAPFVQPAGQPAFVDQLPQLFAQLALFDLQQAGQVVQVHPFRQVQPLKGGGAAVEQLGSFQLLAPADSPDGAQAAAYHQADAGPGKGRFRHRVRQNGLGADKAGDASHKKAEGEDAAGDGQGQPDAKALAGAPADGLDVVPFGGSPVGAVAPPADPAGAGLPLAGVVVGPAVLLLAGAARSE